LTLWRTLKGPTNLGFSFWQGQAELEFPGGEPDVITRMEHGSLTAVVVRLILRTLCWRLKWVAFHTFSILQNRSSTAGASVWLRPERESDKIGPPTS
jgi:hypothetical protein